MSALGLVITVPATRTDTVTVTPGSSTVLDASIAAADAGRAVSGTGIPLGSVVGNVDVGVSFSLYLPNEISTVVPATAVGTSVVIGAILLFQVFDGVLWSQMQAAASTYPLNRQYLRAGSTNDLLPILLAFPASTNLFLGGAAVTSSSTGVGAEINGSNVPSLAYNCVGDDSLFAVLASSTASVQMLVLRQ